MSCKKCGACCKYIAMQVGSLTEDSERWASYHGCRYANGIMFIPCRCSQLGEDNLCKIHDNKPNMCKEMPTRSSIVFHPPECSFYKEDYANNI